MNYLIVDDNKLARMSLKELVSQTKLLEFAGECSSAAEAYQFINTHQVDLLFLDIEMPGISGIDLMKSLPVKPIIIFISAKQNYAVDVFDLNVADYLIKPVTPSRLLEAITKAGKIFENRNATISIVEKEYIFLKDKKALKKINISEILWIEAMGDYIKIHVPEKWYMAHTSLRQLEEKLSPEKFMKIHRSYIVALNKIDSIEDNVIHINKNTIPLADSCRQLLFEKINTI
jgi:DNA-binding LytR/AlgR family response regulator